MKKREIKINGILLLFAVCIFILLITILSNKSLDSEINKDLAADAKRVLVTVFNSYEIEDQVESLLNNEYSEIKESLDIESDFCVYFKDEKGNVVQIKEGVTGIGSPDININGVPCR